MDINQKVSNKELYLEICKSKEQDKLTARALELLMLMVHKLAYKKLRHSRIEYKEDCISSAYLDILKYWRGFDISRTNPFAYYTSLITNGLTKGFNQIYYPAKGVQLVRIDTDSVNNI